MIAKEWQSTVAKARAVPALCTRVRPPAGRYEQPWPFSFLLAQIAMVL